MTLFPTKFENGKIEYKIRYKGRSRPFSRAKALVTSEQSRDPTKLKELLSQVLTITLDGVKEPARPTSSIELETGQLDRVPQLDRVFAISSVHLLVLLEFSLLLFNPSFNKEPNFKKQQVQDVERRGKPNSCDKKAKGRESKEIERKDVNG
ncbi:unnamed protein product [Microthlaspi erraticum]|uniref:Uncharacterized protein n=1 Tax=Microthlaspi erraticum TaxID=1685480 RepID=A0A6D2JU94_9BRAS|nr:unnamed protein product [Microthlaspi erraticum]